jgi:hypothetical protein
MSSREIAELTGKRHDQVLRTARYLVQHGITQSVECLYQAVESGREYPEHHLNKRDSLVLVARLSPEFTERVVTLAMVDQVHQRPKDTARRNFNEHLARLIDGEDYFKVCADEIRTHKSARFRTRLTQIFGSVQRQYGSQSEMLLPAEARSRTDGHERVACRSVYLERLCRHFSCSGRVEGE